MTKKISKENKKIVLLLSIFILFAITLSGCNWFGEGILNVFDPKAQIRVNFTEIKFAEDEGTIDLEIYSINQVEFIGEGFGYKYYNDGVLIPDLTKTVGMAFYVAHSDSPGTPGDITEITDLPLYYQQVLDYVKMNPMITEITCTISLIGTDGAGHGISKSVTVEFPAIQPGVDFEPPTAEIDVIPDTTGTAPFSVIFDASKSKDDRGIASYSWDFGDGSTGSGVVVEHTYNNVGAYNVTLTVTDYFGNKGYAFESITVDYFTAINIIVVAVPASFASGGGDSTITAYVIDSVGEPVVGVNVIFSTEGGTLSNTVDVTDADGTATTALAVPPNSTDNNITIKVTAHVGSQSGSTTITVLK
ncbi:MAG: PKD domain-containing protein [Atribacterota bacterium]|nr:PKD domain-containing protein [Atribacterota bacterium]MDD4896977.1 PKD domain-containing protein [Atribacterota bacterium]MDD5636219.1 PKD domain-containing protein [Atribacterota bacterium]